MFRKSSCNLLLIFVCCFAVGVTDNRQPTYAQSLERIERERAQSMLNAVKDELKKNYYDTGFGGMDVEARFKASEEKLKQATSLGQALGIVAQSLLDLNDSHTFFIPPSRPVKVEYGWQMQMIGDKCYVIAVKPESDAAAKGLKPGDLIVSVEGFKPSRKEMWKMEYYYYTLSPRQGLRLVVQSPGGEPRQLDVAAKMRQGKRILDLSGRDATIDLNELDRESEDAYRLQRHRFQKVGDIVIWKMPGFDFEPEQASRLIDEYAMPSAGLILDLRGNPGGYVLTLERLASHFFDHEVKIADLKGRKDLKPMVAKKRGDKPFAGRLVVLIDSKSGSAAELFARLMQIEKRGTIIGDQSSGSVMRSKVYIRELGVDKIVPFAVSVTDADVIMTDGKSLEHIGVTPDERLIPTAEDLAAGRDPVLARAAAILGVKLDPAVAGKFFPIEWK
ncbi:MAG: S41 family peptidase [Acidobacteriota bacterium]